MLIFDLDGTLIDSPAAPAARPGALFYSILLDLPEVNPGKTKVSRRETLGPATGRVYL